MYLNPLCSVISAARSRPTCRAPWPDDGALRVVVAQFRDIDFQQLYLCSAYDCDCDQIPGLRGDGSRRGGQPSYRSPTYPAETWAGIVAKAEVIKTQSVWHDRDLSESIGDSIAEDVLRLAGRSWDPKLNRVGLTLPIAPARREARAA